MSCAWRRCASGGGLPRRCAAHGLALPCRKNSIGLFKGSSSTLNLHQPRGTAYLGAGLEVSPSRGLS